VTPSQADIAKRLDRAMANWLVPGFFAAVMAAGLS